MTIRGVKHVICVVSTRYPMVHVFKSEVYKATILPMCFEFT